MSDDQKVKFTLYFSKEQSDDELVSGPVQEHMGYRWNLEFRKDRDTYYRHEARINCEKIPNGKPLKSWIIEIGIDCDRQSSSKRDTLTKHRNSLSFRSSLNDTHWNITILKLSEIYYADFSMENPEIFADTRIKVGGDEFWICKTTLASFSPYLRNLFFASELPNNDFNFPDIKADQFQELLEFIYHKCEIDMENVFQLLEGSHSLGVTGIVKKCEKFLMEERRYISPATKISLGEKYKLQDLIDHTIENTYRPVEARNLIPEDLDELRTATMSGILKRIQLLEMEKRDRRRLLEAEKTKFILYVSKEQSDDDVVSGPVQEHMGYRWNLEVRDGGDEYLKYEKIPNGKDLKSWSIEISFTGMTEDWAEPIRKTLTNSMNEHSLSYTEGQLERLQVTIIRISEVHFVDFSKRDPENFADTKIEVGGKEFWVCKTVLASFSSFFKNLFFHSEPVNNDYNLPDLKADQFQELLEFIYQKTDIETQNVIKLLEISHTLGSPDIVKKCEKFLIQVGSEISPAIKISLGEKYKLQDLIDHTIEHACRYTNEPQDLIPEDLDELRTATMSKILQKIREFEIENRDRRRRGDREERY